MILNSSKPADSSPRLMVCSLRRNLGSAGLHGFSRSAPTTSDNELFVARYLPLSGINTSDLKHFFCYKSKDRYWVKWVDSEGRKHHMARSRFIYEKLTGHALSKTEILHHKNHIKTDDRLENLELTDKRAHILKHAQEAKESGEKWGRNTLPTNYRPNGQRFCSRCKETKPISDFSRRPKGPGNGTHMAWCKTCLSRYTASIRPPGYFKDYRKKKALAFIEKTARCEPCRQDVAVSHWHLHERSKIHQLLK